MLLAIVFACVVLLDQVSKNWAVSELSKHTIELFWTLRLQLTFNKGIAFSLGGDRGQVIALVALVVVGFVLYTGRNDVTRVGAVSRGLIVGGAVGNLLDRLLRDGNGFMSGRVVDFIDVQWWPVFNLADASVVIGCLLLVVSIVSGDDGRPDPRRPGGADGIDSIDLGRPSKEQDRDDSAAERHGGS